MTVDEIIKMLDDMRFTLIEAEYTMYGPGDSDEVLTEKIKLLNKILDKIIGVE